MHGNTKTHCKRGHPRVPSNLNGRGCKGCAEERRKNPEVKAGLAAYERKPEVRAAAAVRRSKPEAKAKKAAYDATPEQKYRKRRDELKPYGWTPEMVETAKVEQGNKCAVCRVTFIDSRHTHADHEHTVPPKPRALLCSACNTSLGGFMDDPKICRQAAEYLEKYKGD